MVAAVAVKDIDVVYLIKLVLHGVRGENSGNARVEAAAEDSGQPRLLEALAVSPLPAILKLRGVLRLVVGSIHIGDAAGKARVHDVKILVRKRYVNYDFRVVALDERGQLLNVVRVHLGGCDDRLCGRLELLLECVALSLGAACYHDFRENIAVLAALVYYHTCDAARADYHCSAH